MEVAQNVKEGTLHEEKTSQGSIHISLWSQSSQCWIPEKDMFKCHVSLNCNENEYSTIQKALTS